MYKPGSQKLSLDVMTGQKTPILHSETTRIKDALAGTSEKETYPCFSFDAHKLSIAVSQLLSNLLDENDKHVSSHRFCGSDGPFCVQAALRLP